jgi:hypothetical protein
MRSSCYGSVLRKFSGTFPYLFSSNVTSTSDVTVVYNYGKPSARRVSAAKALEIILADSGSDDVKVDFGREVGTRSDDDFITNQEELSGTEDNVETIENSSSEGDSEAEQDQPADNAADTVRCCRVW